MSTYQSLNERTKVDGSRSDDYLNDFGQSKIDNEEHRMISRKTIYNWKKKSIEEAQQYADQIRERTFDFLQRQIERFENSFEALERPSAEPKTDFRANDHYIVHQRAATRPTLLNKTYNSTYSSIGGDQSTLEVYPSEQEHSEFHRGRYIRRFHIEQYQQGNSILFGIISQLSEAQTNPYKNPTLFGWTNRNGIYRAGVLKQESLIYQADYQNGDIITLIIDCDQQLLTLQNKRNQRQYHLAIDREKCPIPWLLSVRLDLNVE